MAEIEGERPQNKKAAFDAGQQGGASHEKEQPEIHYGGTPVAKPEFENGKLISVTHLHMDRRGEQLRWWSERESLAEWGKRVESAHEQKDRRYRSASADHIPSVVAHTYDNGRLRDAIGIYYSHENFPGLSSQTAKGRYVNHLNQRFAEEISGGYQGQQGQERETAGAKDASSQEQGELAKSRDVLQTIVNTHEDTIDETTPLDRIAGLTTEQIRVAEGRVAQDIVHDESGYVIDAIKKTPQGRLWMLFGVRKETLPERWEVGLYLSENESNKLVMTNMFALDQPLKGMEEYYGFEDFRPGGKRANLGHLAFHTEKGKQLDDIRIMWRGLRWMSANMLRWNNPNTIMPEELGSAPLRNRSDNNR